MWEPPVCVLCGDARYYLGTTLMESPPVLLSW